MKILVVVMSMLAAGLVGTQSSQSGKPHIPDAPFALIPGSHWVYEGVVKWTPPGSSEVFEKNVRWRMEVLETIDRHAVVAARIKGHPDDLAWFEEGREPREYVIVQVWQDRYYLLQGERAETVLRQLRSDEEQFIDIVREDELFLELPLVEGRVFGTTTQITRLDRFYCWVVGQRKMERVQGIPALSKNPVPVWEVSHHTIGGWVAYEFVQGVGFTRYRYHHNGTVSEFEVRLIEYKQRSD